MKLTLARSPMATIYRHLATYFSFPRAILVDKASGWLGCAVHGMCYITRESEMTLELFRFVKQSAMTSHSPTARLDSDTMQPDASSSKNPSAPPLKRRHFNSEWAEGHKWLKHDNESVATKIM